MLTKIVLGAALVVGSTSAVLANSYDSRMPHRPSVAERPAAMFGGRNPALTGHAEEVGVQWNGGCVTDDGYGRVRPCSAN
jgi:hypothetical protein